MRLPRKPRPVRSCEIPALTASGQPLTVADAATVHRDDPADPLADLRALPVPPARGWALRGGGRDVHVRSGELWQGTTVQLAGLFPFVGAAGARVRGVPIGHHIHTHEPVGLDPGLWLREGLIASTALWIQAQPGVGKSALGKRLGTGLVASGWSWFVPGDCKGEYTPVIHRLGGQVITIGRGREGINPLDPGPLAAVMPTVSGRERQALRESIRARQAALLDGLLLLELGRGPSATERALLSRALDLATDAAADQQPTIPDMVAVLAEAPESMLAAARVEHNTARYFDLVREIVSGLELLCEGPLRGLFDRRSTVCPDPDSRATSIDISALDEESDEVVAAAVLCSWAWGAGMIEARQIGHGRNILWTQDEFWRALRTAPGLVERCDRMTRLDRYKGVASVYLTHSMDDLIALPTEHDRAKARGIAARCSVHVYGGLPVAEVHALTASLSDREKDQLASWQSAGTWVAGHRHPGRGLVLIKVGERPGLPVRLRLSAREIALYDTDTAFTLSTADREG